MGGDRSSECSDGKIYIRPHGQEHTRTPPPRKLLVGREEGCEDSDPKGTKGACCLCSELKESGKPTAKRKESKV